MFTDLVPSDKAKEGENELTFQVEYYFSMQNLAMDFFLRQQVCFLLNPVVRADGRSYPE